MRDGREIIPNKMEEMGNMTISPAMNFLNKKLQNILKSRFESYQRDSSLDS